MVWCCGLNKGIRQGASQKKRDWSTMPIININSNVVIYNKSNNVINIIGNSETGNGWFLIFFLYLQCFLSFLLPCLPCLMCQTSHKLKISLLLISKTIVLIILMRKSIWYENKQMSMATVSVHQTRWQLFVCHKEYFPLCFALTRPCLMWLISHQMKITHLLTVATAFETMLLFSGNVKDLKNYLPEMRTLAVVYISQCAFLT